MPEYAILSHTWGDDELTFKDMANLREVEGKAGLEKVRAACRQAYWDGLGYIWVDTCCINKESSSELSEAINSMYAWYQRSYKCYAYLVDVPDDDDPSVATSAFWKSRWFSRGWTLQELLAPTSVVFYGTQWHDLGTKASLQPEISAITGIEPRVILMNHTGEVSIATRMSWAAHRVTTREEDIAYCLMGLFGVHMPLLYGEGKNAFIRLQHEIIKLSDDQSIFAWLSDANEERGLLAHHPWEFARSRHIIPGSNNQATHYSITNKGIHIELPLLPVDIAESDVLCALLNCTNSNDHNIAIFLKKEKGNQYTRQYTSFPYEIQASPEPRPCSLFVTERDPSKFDISTWMRPERVYICSVRVTLPAAFRFMKPQAYPPGFWVEEAGDNLNQILTMNGSGSSGILVFTNLATGIRITFVIGVHNYSVWSDVLILTVNKETPRDIHSSYYNVGHPRHSILWKNRDRSSAFSHGLAASVSIQKILLQQERQYKANIEIKGDVSGATRSGSRLTRWTPPNDIQYTFRIVVTVLNCGYTLSEALPKKGSDDAYWEAVEGSKILCLKHSGISGILLFEDKSEKFAVTIGIHNYRVWTHIVTDFKQETAYDIWRSYYTEGGRGGELWEQRRESAANLTGGSVSVAVRSIAFEEKSFIADIWVGRR